MHCRRAPEYMPGASEVPQFVEKTIRRCNAGTYHMSEAYETETTMFSLAPERAVKSLTCRRDPHYDACMAPGRRSPRRAPRLTGGDSLVHALRRWSSRCSNAVGR